MGQGRKRKMTSRIFIHLFIMKLWSNYLQHTGNQSLYKANLQSIQKCAKMSQYLRHSWLSHRFLHFHTSIFDTKKFFWQKSQRQEKRTSCNSSQSHRPIGSITSLLAATSSETNEYIICVMCSDQLFITFSLKHENRELGRAVPTAMAI